MTPHTTVSTPPLAWSFSGANLTLTWSSGYLQSATNASGPYADVSGAVSPLVIYPQATDAPKTQFYRVRQ